MDAYSSLGWDIVWYDSTIESMRDTRQELPIVDARQSVPKAPTTLCENLLSVSCQKMPQPGSIVDMILLLICHLNRSSEDEGHPQESDGRGQIE